MKSETSVPAATTNSATMTSRDWRTDTKQTTTETRNDTRPSPSFYDVPDDNSVDSEEEIAFFEPPSAPPVDTSRTATSPQMYKYGNSAHSSSIYGNNEIETESGEAESIFASKTLEEKIRGLRI